MSFAPKLRISKVFPVVEISNLSPLNDSVDPSDLTKRYLSSSKGRKVSLAGATTCVDNSLLAIFTVNVFLITRDASARSTLEIIKHIYSLTKMISSSFKNQQYEFSDVNYSYKDLREKTLLNLKYIHEQLKLNPDFSKLNIRFERGGNMMEFPFWNQINGPISDALWHCGQVVMNRRASGNPLQSGVNVFIGKTSGLE